jgi:carboxypeptidase T
MKRIAQNSSSSARRALLRVSSFVLAACAVLAGCSDAAELGDPQASEQSNLASQGATLKKDEVIFAHVYYKDEADLERIVEEYDALEDADRDAGWVAVLLDPKQYDDLRKDGYRADVVRRETIVPLSAGHLTAELIPGYSCYRSVEETYASMNAIGRDFPNLATVVDIGNSWDKVTAGGNPGYDLLVLKLTNSAIAGPKPAFFLMGAIHAREYTTAETAMRFAEEMVNGYGTNADATWLLDHFELHVLPQANPDGRKIAEQGHYQRKNRNNSNGGSCSNPPTSSNQSGTDMNRNSSFKYGGASTSTSQCSQTYRGPSALSEPETQAIQNYVASIFPDQRGPNDTDPAPSDATGVLISLHSYSPKVLFPWGYTSLGAPNKTQLQTLGRKFGFHTGYSVCQPPACLYAASGTTDDWSYGELGVASYTFEMGTSFFQACSSFTGTILPANLAALRDAFKAARRPYQTPAGPDTVNVAVSPSTVTAGGIVTLTATADDTRYKSNGYGTEPTQTIASARYTVDAPTWAGAIPVAMSAADGAFSATQEGIRATINTTGWLPGRHLIFVESQDAAGNRGAPTGVFITVQ